MLTPYVCTFEEASHIGITCLALNLCKDPLATSVTGRVSYYPALKATSLQTVIGLDSAHHPAIHMAWLTPDVELPTVCAMPLAPGGVPS